MTEILLSITLVLLLGVTAVLYYMLKYNRNFLNQIQTINGLRLKGVSVGEEAPPFRVFDVNRKRIVSKELFSKKNTLILFVNTLCPTCKNILEDLPKISSHYDLNILVVNNDEIGNDTSVRERLPHNVTYIRSSNLPSIYFVQATPTACIIEDEKIKSIQQLIHINQLYNQLLSEKSNAAS